MDNEVKETKKTPVFSRSRLSWTGGAAVAAALLVLTILAYKNGSTSDLTQQSWFLPLSAAASLAAGVLICIRFPWKWYQILRNTIFIAVIPFLAVICVQYYMIDPFGEKPIYTQMLILNALFYYLFYFFLVFIYGRFKAGYLTASIILMAIGITNYFVIQFRGSPVVPWDLYSIGTAASVAGNFTYEITWRFVFASIGMMALIIASLKLTWKPRKIWIRIPGVILTACLFALTVKKLQTKEFKDEIGMDQTMFTPTVRNRNNGFIADFLGDLHLINVEKPENYSVRNVKAIETKIEESSESQQNQETARAFDAGKAPNIIVIMNEAFSDLSVRGNFGVSEDPIPFFHKLMGENGGHLMVSVKGGNTANTEWEFLSGDTMAFLPAGSIPYQQFIRDNIPALPSYLASLGYDTTAIHPYLPTGWNRSKVYSLIGFQQFLSIDSFVNPVYLRNLVSDESAFDKIIETYETGREGGNPQFIFEVTMQNHSGYSPEFPGFEPTIELTDLTSQNVQTRAAEKYLTLTNYSDKALEKLVDYFSRVDDPTIIVMFGDHQPSDYVTNVIDNLTGYDPLSDDLEEAQKSYIVPYIVWNNFGMQMEKRPLNSVNYLAADILEAAGIPLTEYQEFLLKLQEKIPAAAAGAYVDQDGTYHSYDENDSTYTGMLDQYNILQYNHMTDISNRVTTLFTLQDSILNLNAEDTTEKQ